MTGRAPAFEPLPHAFPFRFADRTLERTGPGTGRVLAAVSANARATSSGRLSASLIGELIAQAALLLSAGDAQIGKNGFLAGMSDVTIERVPEAGDVLTVEVSLAGRLGAVVKFDGSVVDDQGRRVAKGSVTVREGSEP